MALSQRTKQRSKKLMKMVLCDAENMLLREIANSKTRRRDVAQTYRLAMESGECINWEKVNTSICERWSTSGLIWIKKQAHSGKCFVG